jgi:hypothetical protein
MSNGKAHRSGGKTPRSTVPSQPLSVKQARQERRREEQRRREEERRRARRSRFLLVGGLVVVLAVLVASGLYFFVLARPQTQGRPIVDPAYPPVDNVYCDPTEQIAVHYHAHLSIYINGKPVTLPANVGIASDCFYWLHTHDTTGVIHIEAPQDLKFTLGQFFQIWERQFGELGNGFLPELDQTSGWTVYVNGTLYRGDFHTLVLRSHQLITLAYNSPGVQPDTTYNWGEL